MTSQNRLERSVSIVSDPFSDPDVYYGEDDVRKRGAHRRTFSAVRNEPLV
jgi:alpha,alpha-trehalase